MPKVYAIDGIVPVVDPSAFVHPTAVLTGDVIVGADCYVGPGASLRGDHGRIEMKRGSNFQDNCTAHTFSGGEVIIAEHGSVGHGAVLHGCTIGARALVGMNAVVMDGAVIGDDCIVAALSFVRAGFEAPAATLLAGVPAEIKRDLGERELSWKTQATQDYLRLTPRCHASLERVEALTEPTGARLDFKGSKPLHTIPRKDAS
jgi:phenylacetic acid degradation protein